MHVLKSEVDYLNSSTKACVRRTETERVFVVKNQKVERSYYCSASFWTTPKSYFKNTTERRVHL